MDLGAFFAETDLYKRKARFFAAFRVRATKNARNRIFLIRKFTITMLPGY
jgi:hypothetical protein